MMNAPWKTAIVMDSGGDLPVSLCEKEGIDFLPLHVIYPERDYLDGVDIDPQMIYDRFSREIPSTSTPSPQEIHDLFDRLADQGYESAIVVTISAALSGTGGVVEMVAAEYTRLRVHVFDTRNISFGSGIFALWAARKRKEGLTFEELIDALEKKRDDSKQFFYMDTLKYLRHGGRIGHVASFVGEALRIKPIISCDRSGVYYTVAKIRGSLQGKKRLLEEAIRAAGDRPCWYIIGEGCAKEEAAKLQQMIRERLPKAIHLFTKQITATLANNTGPGLVGVMVFRDP